jgi:hypothetical protein
MNNLERCTKTSKTVHIWRGYAWMLWSDLKAHFADRKKKWFFVDGKGVQQNYLSWYERKGRNGGFLSHGGTPMTKSIFGTGINPWKKKSSVFGVSPWKAPMLHSPSWSCLIPIDGIKHDKPFTSICEYLIYLWFTAQCISLPLTTNGASERCPCHSPDHLGQEDIQLNSHGANFRWIRGTRIGNFQVLYCSYLRLVNVAFSMSIYVIDIWLRLVSSMRRQISFLNLQAKKI